MYSYREVPEYQGLMQQKYCAVSQVVELEARNFSMHAGPCLASAYKSPYMCFKLVIARSRARPEEAGAEEEVLWVI